MQVEIWFDTDVESGIPDNGYPFGGDVGAYRHDLLHPDVRPERVLPVRSRGRGARRPGRSCPSTASCRGLDGLDQPAKRRGKQDVTFTAVGYGLQRHREPGVGEGPSECAWSHIVNTERDQRHRASPATSPCSSPTTPSTGGTCFGDSGGPELRRHLQRLVGVTSFGLNGNCAGTGGVYRIDRADELDWITTFLS